MQLKPNFKFSNYFRWITSYIKRHWLFHSIEMTEQKFFNLETDCNLFQNNITDCNLCWTDIESFVSRFGKKKEWKMRRQCWCWCSSFCKLLLMIKNNFRSLPKHYSYVLIVHVFKNAKRVFGGFQSQTCLSEVL